ncbi:MAG: hypothetical protein IT564_12500 [Rhodospirillales bacterium]|nr:hypothetical protein [Rhodospirillales bacterium]
MWAISLRSGGEFGGPPADIIDCLVHFLHFEVDDLALYDVSLHGPSERFVSLDAPDQRQCFEKGSAFLESMFYEWHKLSLLE